MACTPRSARRRSMRSSVRRMRRRAVLPISASSDRLASSQRTMEKLRSMIKVAGPTVGLGEADLAKRSEQGKAAEAQRLEAESAANLKRHAGNKAFAHGDFAKAAALYGEAIALTPESHVLYSNRAQALLELKELEKALQDAEK